MRKLDAEQNLHLVPLKLNESWAGRRLIEALSQLSPSSYGSSLDMKFQQKQQQEREQRRIEMIGERTVSSDSTSTGKVRQMFDERRRGAGIDRSNPLKPLPVTTKTSVLSSTAVTTVRNGNVQAGRRPTPTVNVKRNIIKRVDTFDQSNDANGNISRTHNMASSFDQIDHIMNETKALSTLSLTEQKSTTNGFNNSNNNNNNYLRTKSSNSIKLKPVLTKKSPTVASTRTVTSPRNTAGKVQTTPRTSLAANNSSQKKSSTPNTVKTSLKNSAGKMASAGVRIPPREVPPAAGMATCKICHRNFTEDRLPKHEQVCQKMANSKRKIFDASKHRVKGTEAEKYLKKPIRIANTNKQPMQYTSAAAATGLTPPANSAVKKNNWRQKHEEFISAIRAAKQVQAHLAKGGKLSDLPPPPPSENPDYIQCPHCLRRFNESAAERHIPRCATMLHNKPKPNNAKKR